MPTYPIPHNAPSIPNPTPTSDPQFMGPKRNMYVDITGTVRSRPGVKATYTLDASAVIEGMVPRWQGTNQIMVCSRSAGTVYWDELNINKSPTSITLNRSLTTTVTSALSVPVKPNMLAYSASAVLFLSYYSAQNINTYSIPGSETNYNLSSAGFTPAWDPTRIAKAVLLNNMIVACETTSTGVATDVIRFSNVGDPLTWASGNFFTAESSGDYVTTIEELNGNLILFGPQNIEVREYDGSSFPLVPGGVVNVGCSAGGGVVKHGDQIYFIDFHKNLCVFDGRQVQKLPFNYANHLIETISYQLGGAMQAYALNYRGKKFLFINDRSSSGTKGMVYDLDNGDSYEWDWGTTSSTGLGWSCLMSFPYIENETLIAGSASNEKVGVLAEDYHSGFAGNETQRKGITTAWINHGTNKAKKSTELRIYVEREPVTAQYPVVTVRYKNNGSTSIAATRTIQPELATYQYACYRLKALGHYRERQYEIFTDTAASFRIARIEEDVTFL